MQKYKVAEAITGHAEQSLLSYPPLLRQLLFARGIGEREEAEKFLNPSYEAHTHDPFLLKDMEKAVGRILKALEKNERIAVWSDYDADGIPGAVVFHDFFKKLGLKSFALSDEGESGKGVGETGVSPERRAVSPRALRTEGFSNEAEPNTSSGGFMNYIPDRHTEGFGLSNSAIEQLHNSGTRLLITIDCGITDREEVARANELGMDVIITDHHLPNGGGLPSAYAILNPKQDGCPYPEKMLCGSGVVFKLIQALCLRLSDSSYKLEAKSYKLPPEGWEKWLLDMVGLATLSDMVPLTGENRVLAHFGLKVLRKSPRVGLGQLLQELRIRRSDLTEDDVGFSITPRINAASRMGVPMDAFRLFATEDAAEAGALAKHLNRINDERKGKVASLVKEARRVVEERHQTSAPLVVVAGNPNWRPALLGLVANALVEDYRKPVFVWGREGGEELKGSCRSDGSVDVTVLMQEARAVFSDFGGHREAGGFSVVLEKVHLLEEELERAYEKIRSTRSDLSSDSRLRTASGGQARSDLVDARLSLDEVNWDMYREIERLAPFGVGNPKPLFLFEQITVSGVEQFGKERQHLKIIFQKSNGERISAVRFYAKPEDFGLEVRPQIGREVEPRRINLLAHLEKSTFRDTPELRLRIVDVV